MGDYCLPTFIENLNASNCLNMWVYAYKLNFDELKTAAFKTLDENWKMHQNSSEFLEMMKSAPNAVLEIMNRFQKITDCQPIVLKKEQTKKYQMLEKSLQKTLKRHTFSFLLSVF